MEYYSALKGKEILTYAITWVNLKDIVLSEISQSQKDKHCKIPLTWGTWSNQNHKDKKQNVVPRGAREELFNGYITKVAGFFPTQYSSPNNQTVGTHVLKVPSPRLHLMVSVLRG